jgi:signal peptidase I
VYENRQFTINGETMKTGNDEAYISPIDNLSVSGAIERLESLGGVEHAILEYPNEFPKRSGSIVVPAGHYFMVGDNRDRSNDSRFWGFVPEENLVGEAKYIWMHWNEGVIWTRLMSAIK